MSGEVFLEPAQYGGIAGLRALISDAATSEGVREFWVWRTLTKTTLTEAALLLNVDPLFIRRLDAGEVEPSEEMAERIAIITGGLVSVESWDHPAGKIQTSHGCGSGGGDPVFPSPPVPFERGTARLSKTEAGRRIEVIGFDGGNDVAAWPLLLRLEPDAAEALADELQRMAGLARAAQGGPG